MRICWETNGNIHPKYLDDMARTSLSSGGIIKFDLKARDEKLHRIFTGASNRQTFKNIKYIYQVY
ncbi:MAG: radical SAM protein, partial [Methanothermobacter sp.]|nr:radical SAM protein [Methanothermobacter sp.]